MKLGLITPAIVMLAGCADAGGASSTVAVESAASLTVASDGGAAGGLEPVTNFGTNPAKLNMYRYVPSGVGSNAPLVVLMHGCSADGAKSMLGTGFNQLADTLKFYVVYPEQTAANNYAYCFNWAGVYGNPDNLHRGKGENESIKEMVDKMKADYSIDPKRVFAVGFSAGGAEAALMLATWPDVFAAGATFGGIPYDCAETLADSMTCMNNGVDKPASDWAAKVTAAYSGFAGPWPRLSIWQGTSDTTVNTKNFTQLMRQWTQVNGLPQTPSASDKVNDYPHDVYKDGSGNVVVETYSITGQAHGVFVDPASGCGTAGSFVLDAKICGPAKVAEFFGLTQPAPIGDDAGTSAPDGGASVDGGGADGSPDGAAHPQPSADGGGAPGSGGYGHAPSGTPGADGGGLGADPGNSGSGLAGCAVGASRRRDAGGGAFFGFGLGLLLWARRSASRKKVG